MFSDKDKLFDLYYEGNWDLTATRASFKYKVIGNYLLWHFFVNKHM